MLLARPLLFVVVVVVMSLPLLNSLLVLGLGGCYVNTLLKMDGTRSVTQPRHITVER
jgi:hypothetical protein